MYHVQIPMVDAPGNEIYHPTIRNFPKISEPAESQWQRYMSTKNGAQSIDYAHAMLIQSSILSAKPVQILELGFGTGFVSNLIMDAIEFNECGFMECVDNWLDFGGNVPLRANMLSSRGAAVTTADELSFIKSCADGKYDFLVSDACHEGDWFPEHLRITANGSICFFHDTNQWGYRGLYSIEQQCRDRGLSYFHFKTSSRPDEHCERGMMMVINRKQG